jgi:uncharacterized membrane protein
MDTLLRLLDQRPLIFVHMVAAIATLLLGAALLARRTGTPSHRALGWTWVLLMATVVVTSVFMRDYRLPNLAGYTPIHLLTVYVALLLPRAVLFARRGEVARHRVAMRRLYIGGCVVAGLFTFVPGRFFGSLLMHQLSALMA